MYRRNQRKNLAEFKKDKEDRKVIIKQIRNPMSRRDEMKKNAEKKESEESSWGATDRTKEVFKSKFALQMEKNE